MPKPSVSSRLDAKGHIIGPKLFDLMEILASAINDARRGGAPRLSVLATQIPAGVDTAEALFVVAFALADLGELDGPTIHEYARAWRASTKRAPGRRNGTAEISDRTTPGLF